MSFECYFNVSRTLLNVNQTIKLNNVSAKTLRKCDILT